MRRERERSLYHSRMPVSVIAAEAAEKERELVDAAVMKGWRETESEGESERLPLASGAKSRHTLISPALS